MKWRNRTAQAFRPGKASHRIGPERATESLGRSAVSDERGSPHVGPKSRVSAALSGRMLQQIYPGLKPWAVLLRHFMAALALLR